jgi:hypothetical protein
VPTPRRRKAATTVAPAAERLMLAPLELHLWRAGYHDHDADLGDVSR